MNDLDIIYLRWIPHSKLKRLISGNFKVHTYFGSFHSNYNAHLNTLLTSDYIPSILISASGFEGSWHFNPNIQWLQEDVRPLFRRDQIYRGILQKLRLGARHSNMTVLTTTAIVQKADLDLYHDHARFPEVEVEVDLEVGIGADRSVEPQVLLTTIRLQEVQRSALVLFPSFLHFFIFSPSPFPFLFLSLL